MANPTDHRNNPSLSSIITTVQGWITAGLTNALITSINVDGWMAAGETWTYASADSTVHTWTFTISGDKSTKYYPGMKIKLTQSASVAYYIITAVSYSNPTTTITVYGGTDYVLANSAISANFYSVSKAPAGFPMSPAKWTETLSDLSLREQTSPTAG